MCTNNSTARALLNIDNISVVLVFETPEGMGIFDLTKPMAVELRRQLDVAISMLEEMTAGKKLADEFTAKLEERTA